MAGRFNFRKLLCPSGKGPQSQPWEHNIIHEPSSDSNSVPVVQITKWRRKWSLKLRDRINRTLSLRKSLPLSETSDTKRIGAHQHQDGDDWVHTTLASTVAADSHDLHCEAENVFLEPAASTGSYYTVASTASLQSAQSNYRLDEPVEQLDDTAPDWASHSNELLSSPNSRTQIQRISFPAVPDSDPPPSPGLKSEYDAVPQDEALWESFRELHQESRWLAAGEKLRQCKSMHSAPQQAVHEVAKMVHSLDHFRESMRETSRYQQSSKQPLQTPMQMFYRPPEQGQMHNIRAVADFCVKSVEILALAREFDLVKTWNWTVSESAILENRSEFDVDALAVLKMPWPYKPRFAAFSCKGGDLLDERSSLAVLFQSCCQDVLPCEDIAVEAQVGIKPKGAENAEEVRILEGSGVSIQPCWTTEGGKKVNIDPLMALVPPVIINFVLMIMAPMVYRLAKHIVNTSRKPGTKLYMRIKERQAFYERVDARVQHHLASGAAPHMTELP